MAKYSTGKSGSFENEPCQLCGRSDVSLTKVNTENAEISVCNDCKSSKMEQDTKEKNNHEEESVNYRPEETENKNPGYTINRTESDWVQETDYGNVGTPYMRNEYAQIFNSEIERRGITLGKLSKSINVPTEKLTSIRNGKVMSNNIERKVIEKVEQKLDIQIKEKES